MSKTTKPKGQPRFVVYASKSEVDKATERAKRDGLKTHHKWAGAVIRKELNK